MEDNPSLNKIQSQEQKNKSSLKIKGTSEINSISSKQKKKKSEDTEGIDLTNKILSKLCYENFESENETFHAHFRKKHDEIYIDKVSLLNQNRFRFLISNNAEIFNNYTKYENGNFKNIKWEDIKLIYYYYVEDYQCPICLENKICCPIITNCGHIFCYPCFLTFYNYYTIVSINKKLPNCPLCSEKIDLEKNEIKFCEMIKCHNYTNNMQIKFNLIMREKVSPTLFNLFYDPSLKKWEKMFKFQMKSIPLEITKEFLFSRIFSTNKKLTNARINNLIKELNKELKEEKEFYVDENRIRSLNQCIENLNNILKENEQQKDFIIETVFQKESIEKKDINNKNFNNMKNKFNIENINTNQIKKENSQNFIKNTNENEDINYNNYFFFYQEEEGDIYYLDPFIMNILLTEYGDYNDLPVEISGNIIDFEMKQVTPYLKSNYPFLSHLNIGSIIFFVEIDTSRLISPSTRKKFNHALNERAKRRRLLSNEQKNYEKFINKKINKEQEELKNYYAYQNQLKLLKDIKDEEKKVDKENIRIKNDEKKEEIKNENFNNNISNLENINNKEENKKEEDNKEFPKKENMLKKLLEQDKKEREERQQKEKEEKERLERERLEKEKRENKAFIFDEIDFPELSKINEKDKEKGNDKEEENKNNNNNKGGKKGKKKGKKKFQEIGEDFFKDPFIHNEDEGEKDKTKKLKGKKSSKNN